MHSVYILLILGICFCLLPNAHQAQKAVRLFNEAFINPGPEEDVEVYN